MTAGGTAVGTVRLWMQDEAWGVVDSDDLPGSCWVELAAVEDADAGVLRAGQVVEVTWEEPGPDGYRCRATSARVRGDLQSTPGA